MNSRFFMPVAFFGSEPEEARDTDVWIKGVRYREIMPSDDPNVQDLKSEYKAFPDLDAPQ